MKKYLITLATIVTLILLNSNCIEASYDRNGKIHSVIITGRIAECSVIIGEW